MRILGRRCDVCGGGAHVYSEDVVYCEECWKAFDAGWSAAGGGLTCREATGEDSSRTFEFRASEKLLLDVVECCRMVPGMTPGLFMAQAVSALCRATRSAHADAQSCLPPFEDPFEVVPEPVV